jgi:putative ABC transport system ATP-binding protein
VQESDLTMPQEALHLEDIRKTYINGELQVPVLKGVDMHIDRGEFICIMGSSGAGKSTMLNILGLLDKPTSGSYRLDGQDVAKLSDRELTTLRNIRIGFVFQSFNLFPHLTVQENIEVPMLYSEVPRRKRHKIARALADKVRLSHRLDHRPTQLSGGECQRVAIARSLVNNPTFILADEPTGNLDEKTGTEILGVFDELHRAGSTIIMVTHNPSYEGICDRVFWLRNGRMWKIIDNIAGKTTEFDVQ